MRPFLPSLAKIEGRAVIARGLPVSCRKAAQFTALHFLAMVSVRKGYKGPEMRHKRAGQRVVPTAFAAVRK
jgi:hypothetical protein